jgi:hypothetical protein
MVDLLLPADSGSGGRLRAFLSVDVAAYDWGTDALG